MSRRYVFTGAARDDLREIVFGVDARFGRAVALRVYERLQRALELIAANPAIGRTRPERWLEQYRFFPHGSAVIAYRADVRPIRVNPDRPRVA